MNDELSRRLRERVDARTPESVPEYDEVLALRDQRRHRRRAGVAAVAVMVVVAGTAGTAAWLDRDASGEPDLVAPVTTTPVWEPADQPWGTSPPPIVVHLGDREIDLAVGHYCWDGPPRKNGQLRSICASVVPSTTLLPGSPPVVEFGFPVDGYGFSATFHEVGELCGRAFEGQVEKTGKRTFRVAPGGPEGDWKVILQGRGPRGSVSGNFTWHTPSDGTLPDAVGQVGVVSGSAGDLYAFDAYLDLRDLATTPETASGEVTVTSAEGRSMTFPLHRERQGGGCRYDGTAHLASGPGTGEAVLALGNAPFRYEVRLVLDGTEHIGTGVWPQDEDPENSPATDLTWTPPLPAYTGR